CAHHCGLAAAPNAEYPPEVSSAMSSARSCCLALASLLGLVVRPLAQDEGDRPAARVTQIVAIVQRAGPAVVSVYSDDPDPAAATAGEPARRGSLGSGLLIDADGFILTDTQVLPRGTEGI